VWQLTRFPISDSGRLVHIGIMSSAEDSDYEVVPLGPGHFSDGVVASWPKEAYWRPVSDQLYRKKLALEWMQERGRLHKGRLISFHGLFFPFVWQLPFLLREILPGDNYHCLWIDGCCLCFCAIKDCTRTVCHIHLYIPLLGFFLPPTFAFLATLDVLYLDHVLHLYVSLYLSDCTNSFMPLLFPHLSQLIIGMAMLT
jgi:hypothetical protein